MTFLKNIFFINFLFLFFSSFVYSAQDRVDLDLRFEPKNKNYFYLLKENFNNKKQIQLGKNIYNVIKSENEIFIDEYYDTKLHSLYKKKASLRYRIRSKSNTGPKNLIQFKTQKKNDKLTGMNEFKIELNPDEVLVSYVDLKNYINRRQNQNSTLYKQLRSHVNISKLEQIFLVTQNRDRFYLKDDNEDTIFTISFDEVVYSKELLKTIYLVVEFEINEKIMANSEKINSDTLVKSLNEFALSLSEKNVLLNRTYDNKYTVGIKKLGLKPKTEDIIETIIVFFALFCILILFCVPIFYRKKQNL
ncbi:MAG: hypothetical protein CMI55_04865 [Parcubacteria group bacterium]|nr:hypothetical protein [Parcubacteria group bacterium]|tara:strand:+ start:789 stop:1700 length:912 start_codon:yes stop_codon:yes gene_type:complete